MAFNIMWPLRGLQMVVAFAVLGLMAYVSSWWSQHWHQMSPAEINFTIYTPVWTVVLLPVLTLIQLRFPHLANKWIFLGLEAFTMVEWLASWASMIAFLNGRICFGTVCSVARAGTALATFEWFLFAASFVLMVLAAWGVGNGRVGRVVGMPWVKEEVRGKRSEKVVMHQGV